MKNFEVEFSSDRNIRIEQGQSLLEASLAAGIPHFHVCGGNARCSTCRVLILAGKEQLSTRNEKEIHESADAAVKSGYEILENLEQLNRDYFTKNFDQRINLGISIHTGTVVAGEIRIGNKKQLLVMGYPVNVAARLQNATKELNNNFIISSEALEIPDKLLSDYPSSVIHLRGIAEPVNVHLLGRSYENGHT